MMELRIWLVCAVLSSFFPCGFCLQVLRRPVIRFTSSKGFYASFVVEDSITGFIHTLQDGIGASNLKSIKFSSLLPSVQPNDEEVDMLSGIRSIDGRLVRIRSSTMLQLTYKYQYNVQAKNYNVEQAVQQTTDIIKSGVFREVSLETADQSCKLSVGGTKQNPEYRLTTRPNQNTNNQSTSSSISLAHDQAKEAFISINEPFLEALGITSRIHRSENKSKRSLTDQKDAVPDARPLVGMSDKLHQIQKYVEILDGLVKSRFNQSTTPTNRTTGSGEHNRSPTTQPPLHIMDMGCGLAYLTFAVHSHFCKKFPGLQTTGVEVRPALVQKTERIARSLGEDFPHY